MIEVTFTLTHAIIGLTLLVASICTIFAILALKFAYQAMIEIKSMQKSTHSIQYMPVEQALTPQDAANMDSDPWATPETNFERQNELYKEDLETELPDFVLEDDEKPVSI